MLSTLLEWKRLKTPRNTLDLIRLHSVYVSSGARLGSALLTREAILYVAEARSAQHGYSDSNFQQTA